MFWNPKHTREMRAARWADRDGVGFLSFIPLSLLVILARFFQSLDISIRLGNVLLYMLWGIVLLYIVVARESGKIPSSHEELLSALSDYWPIALALIVLEFSQFLIRNSNHNKYRSELEEERSLALYRASSELLNIGENKGRVKDQARRDTILRDILDALALDTRLSISLERPSGYFRVTLFLYDSNRDYVQIRARSRASEDRGPGQISAKESVGHYAAQRSKPKAIHWLHLSHIFPDRSLSNSNKVAKYRSILALPLSGTGEAEVGYLTVDSERPFEFWGGRPSVLENVSQPHREMIKFVIDSELPSQSTTESDENGD